MILRTLQLHNFRQFYGTSPLMRFASDRSRNTTVFHGMNGAGKTAILNAFIWALYDVATRGFQHQEMLVNFRAVDEAPEGAKVEAWVELEFEHNDTRYRVRRTAATTRGPDAAPYQPGKALSPSLRWCGADGEWQPEEGVRDIVDRILPPDLQSYFFFDGERIERIVDPSKDEQKQLASATKKFLGIQLLDYAVRDLRKGLKILEKEWRDFSETELREILERISQLEHDREDVEDELKACQENLDGYRSMKTEVESQLRRAEGFHHLQESRDRLTEEEGALQERIKASKKGQAAEISQFGAYMCLTWPSVRYNELLEGMRTRRELPSGIKDTFVRDLLGDERCICGTPLVDDTEARSSVEAWLTRAGQTDIEERAMDGQGRLTTLLRKAPESWQRVYDQAADQSTARRRLAAISKELEDISDQLRNAPTEDVGRLESKRGELEQLIEEEIRKQERNQERLQRLDDDLRRERKERDRQKGAEGEADLARRRVQATEDAIQRVKVWRERIEEQFRGELQTAIEETFDALSPTSYIPELDGSFRLRLTNQTGHGRKTYVAASQGENQALSLSFLAGIIEFTRRMDTRASQLPSSGDSRYPLVMDSPFGALDPHYRRTIAEHIPSVADQVVLLVTQTQWRGEVAAAVADRVGRQYLLVYHTPKQPEGDHEVVINGRRHRLLVASHDNAEFTELVEVTDA